MIRHILVISVMIMAAIVSQAQPTGVKYNIGPKLGFNVYKSRFNLSADEEIFDQKLKSGFQIGGTFDMALQNHIHFAMELYYSKKGKETFITDSGLTNDATYHFLEVPVLLRFTFKGGAVASGTYGWHIDIGPTMSYWLSGKGNLHGDGPTSAYKVIFGEPPPNNSAFDKMYISNANRLQWGLAAGIGIDYPVYKHQVVFVDLRIGFGGTNLAEKEGKATIPILGFSESLDVRFIEFSLSAAYTFQVDWVARRKGKSNVSKRSKR